MMTDEDTKLLESFTEHDKNEKGYLTRIELQKTIEEATFQEFDMNHIEILYQEFDKDENGKIDFPEFKVMVKYLKGNKKKKERSSSIRIDGLGKFNHEISEYGTGSSANLAMSMVLNKAIKKSKKDSTAMLRQIAKDIYPVKDMLCIQDTAYDKDSDDEDDDDAGYAMHQSTALDFDFLFDEDDDFVEEGSGINFEEPENTFDPDFEPAFPASDMRCLALVSHNGMKKTMREFVTVNKNLLKKFRLTGTNSTMTMLKEVFADEPVGTVVFGPACASGPLGGDAELVAYMVSGKIGGIIFFQDPMDSHPHRADIDCLVRQALVHNVVMAETPSSALMIAQCLRSALVGKGKPELIPSFFFSLQSPTVEAYKKQQKSVVEIQKAAAAQHNQRASTIM